LVIFRTCFLPYVFVYSQISVAVCRAICAELRYRVQARHELRRIWLFAWDRRLL